jgi:hypothetical protein
MFYQPSPNYQRLPHSSFDSVNGRTDLDPLELEEASYYKFKFPRRRPRTWKSRCLLSWHRFCGRTGPFGRFRRLLLRFIFVFGIIILTLLVVTPIWNPSYTYRPKHYSGMNPRGEKVFIAANIIDKDLIRGPWGKAILDLIDIIGPQNAFLSIYENDSGPETKDALRELAAQVKCTGCTTSVKSRTLTQT